MASSAPVTIIVIEEDKRSSDSLLRQLIRWQYRVVPLPKASLALYPDLLRSAGLIITTRSRWEIERIMKSMNHPPLLTTTEFDLALHDRIKAYLAHADDSVRGDSAAKAVGSGTF